MYMLYIPLIPSIYLKKAKALQDEETGKGRLQINLGATSCKLVSACFSSVSF